LGNETRLVLILTILCFFLFLAGIGARPLWNIDEGMHAATAKDMVLTGDWITPTFNGEKFHDKPPFFNWLTALSLMLFGFTEFAARLPAAALGIGCVALTYLMGRHLGGPVLGFLGGTILATAPMFITLSRAVVHDIALAFFVTLALFLFYRGFTEERRGPMSFILFYAALGLAVLTKGPVGIVIPGLTIGLFLLLKRELRFIGEMRIGWGLLTVLIVAAPWYVVSSLRNPEYAGHFFIQQNLMNFISSEAARHPQPFHYYLPLLMGGFFPWSFFLPVALVRPFWGGFKHIDDGVLYLILWFGAVFVFFSVASSKLGPYILPLFPAASLLVGFLWQELFFAPTANLRKAFVTCTGFLTVGMLGGLGYLFTNQPVELETRYGVDLLRVNGLSVFVSLIVAGSFFLVVTQRYRAAFATNVGTVFMGILLFMTVIAPLINPYRSSKRLALSLNHSAPPGEAFVFFRKPRDSVLFYTNRKAVVLHKPAHLVNYLAAHPAAYAFISRYHFSVFPEIGKASKIVDQEGSDLIIRPKSSDTSAGGAHR